MFLQYAVPGALVPLFSLRLKELGFTPLEMAWACATGSLAGLVGPLVVGQLADRWFPAERCLAVCAFVGGMLLWLLAGLTGPAAVFWTSLAFWLVMVPATTLTVGLCFAHLPSPLRDYAPVRFWGTVGWVTPGWLLGCWFANPDWLGPCTVWLRPDGPPTELADIFRLAGLLSFALGGYALTLPHTPPQRLAGAWLAPLGALRLLRHRAFAIYCASALILCVTIPFTTQAVPLLLEDLGVPRPWLSPTLTLSQSMELASLAVLPVLLLRLGVRGTMLLGLFAWAAELAVLTAGRPLGLVVASLALNGLCICCFLVAGQVFINGRARGDIRVSSQGLLAFVNALGMLLGNLLVGWVRKQVNGEFSRTFAVAAAVATVLAVGFFVYFNPEEPVRSEEAEDAAEQGLEASGVAGERGPSAP